MRNTDFNGWNGSGSAHGLAGAASSSLQPQAWELHPPFAPLAPAQDYRRWDDRPDAGALLQVDFAQSTETDSTTTEHVLDTGIFANPASLDRLRQEVGRLAVELRRQDHEMMTAVLRPDAQTEVALRLRMRDGSVEVDAVCQSGNAAYLQANWDSLQQRLLLQGVRLGPLQSAEPMPFANGGLSGGLAQGRRESEAAAWENTPLWPGPALGARHTTTVAPRGLPVGAPGRGQEWWA
jgi:hypothetical protein